MLKGAFVIWVGSILVPGIVACSAGAGGPGELTAPPGCVEMASPSAADNGVTLQKTRRTDEDQPGAEMPAASTPCVVRVTADREPVTHPSTVIVPDLK